MQKKYFSLFYMLRTNQEIESPTEKAVIEKICSLRLITVFSRDIKYDSSGKTYIFITMLSKIE